jgi:hypothetical protein
MKKFFLRETFNKKSVFFSQIFRIKLRDNLSIGKRRTNQIDKIFRSYFMKYFGHTKTIESYLENSREER